jgi:hypothetical protein
MTLDEILELQKVEKSKVWETGQYKSFEDFLTQEFPGLLTKKQYRDVCNAIEIYGVEHIRRVGVHACSALLVQARKVTQ